MNTDSIMLLLLLAAGCLGVFILAWWMARRGPPTEPFFLRFLRQENKTARMDTRIMLHELHRKIEELSSKVQRMDNDIQKLQERAGENKAGTESIFLSSGQEEERSGEDIPPQGFFSAEEALRRGEKTGPAIPAAQETAAGGRGKEGLCRQIFTLYQQGHSPSDIASNLQLGRGEVELFLSLTKSPSWVIKRADRFKDEK